MSRWLRRILFSLLAIAALLLSVRWALLPGEPDAFYSSSADLAVAPGTLLRSEPFTRQVPAGAHGWRILYASTHAGGKPALASAIVLVGTVTKATPRPVVAWAHGTTGVARGCAPSLLDEPFANVPSVAAALEHGWAFVATDYVGQGTTGPHPYLIGDGEARPVLDAVRAARQLADAAIGDQVVVWGHSQGGHAALWTGMLAPHYAPELRIEGIAAMAPATDLPGLLDAVHATPVGRIISAYLLHAYTSLYPDLGLADLSTGWRGTMARDIARHCMAGSSALPAVAGALLAGNSLFDADPLSGPLAAHLQANVPQAPLPAPLWIAQGLTDKLVLPRVQDGYVAARCAAGHSLEYVRVAGRDHLSLVAADSPVNAWLQEWTAARFAGTAVPAGCATEDR